MNDTDISYYRALDVLDRIEKERIKMKIRACKFSRLLGKCDAYWNVKFSTPSVLRIGTINKIASKINVSLDYLIYGKEYGPYTETEIDVARIPEYTAKKRIYLTDSQKSIVSRIRNGKQHDIGVNLFFQLEEKINKNLLKIIKNS